jgi:hypothetical protein
MDPLEGIAAADAHLGRPVPLPSVALPLGRWTEVFAVGPGAVEVVWNLDDTRPGAPGRLALRASLDEAPTQLADAPPDGVGVGDARAERRRAPLEEAQPSLRPVVELRWRSGGLWLRLTAQGPWDEARLLALAASIGPADLG